MTENIKFYYNGFKVNGGKLIKCYYSLDNNATGAPQVSIYLKDYSDKMPAIFNPKNTTDIYTDYFENDHCRFYPDHSLYEKARAAAKEAAVRSAKKEIEKLEKKINSGFCHNVDFYKQEIEWKKEIIKRYTA